MTQWRREQLGFVFQSFGLLPTLSAYENVELMLRIKGVGARERHERATYPAGWSACASGWTIAPMSSQVVSSSGSRLHARSPIARC